MIDDDTFRTMGEATPRARQPTAASTIDIADQPTIGRYELINEIGQGGMGTVYSAQQTEPIRRKVAVKVINPGMNSREILARFETERQTLALMDHPNIATVLDGGTTDTGLPYFVMELVPGTPITEFCRQHDVGLSERLHLFIDVCRAIHHAHQRGIIHRDLKPTNILVADHDGTPVVKVIDFGVAKALRGELADRTLLTQASQLVGTPIYMSPEQAVRNEFDVDTRSDVYSLGVVLYELLTGTTPIDRATLSRVGFQEFCQIVSLKDPPRPSERIGMPIPEQDPKSESVGNQTQPTSFGSKHLKRELDWIVMKAIARDREDRYASASEFADDLMRYVQGAPVIACPPSLRYRIRKTAMQNRVAVGICAVIIMALTAVAVISRWQIAAVESARLETEKREQRAIDLLHAFKLQGALTAFREEKLVQLLALTTELRSDPLLSAAHARPTDLTNLLSETARRPPKTSFLNRAAVHNLAVTPDRKQFLTVDALGEVRLWTVDGSDESGILLGSHGEPAHAVAVSPDGRLAATGSTSGQLQLWNLTDRSLIRRLTPVQSGIETIAWSPDGQTIAAGARYSEVWVGDSKGNERFRLPNDHRHESLLFSDDGNDLLVPNRQDIGVHDASTGRLRRRLSTQPLSNVRALCFAGPDNRWLVAGERFRENLVVLDYDQDKLLGQIPLGLSYPRDLSVSENGQMIRASFSGGQVQLIQLSPSNGGASVKGTIRSEFRAHAPEPDHRLPMAFVAGNHQFLSGGADGRIHLWDEVDLRTIEIRRRPDSIFTSYLNPDDGDIGHVPYSNLEALFKQAQAFTEQSVDGKMAVARKDELTLVDAEGRRVVAEIESPLRNHRHVAIAAGGAALIAGSTTEICIWRTSNDWRESRLVNRFKVEHRAAPILCDDGRTLIVDDAASGQLSEIDIATQAVKSIANITDVRYVILDPSERRLGVVLDRGFCIWDRLTSEVLLQADQVGRMGQMRFTHDGVTLLDFRRDGHIYVWHLPTQQKLGLLYRPDFAIGTLLRCQLTHQSPRLMLEFADDHGGTHLLVIPCRSRRKTRD